MFYIVMNKLYIFGSNGMLGNYLKTYFSKHLNYYVVPLTRQHFDARVDSFRKLDALLNMNNQHFKNIVVFNALGAIPQACAIEVCPNTDNSFYYKVNTVFPMMLSTICENRNIKLIHPTTDCVFSGALGKYTEDSPHDAASHYGISKSLGENIKGTIIRTSIIGENAKGISLVEWIKSHKNNPITGFTNHLWNGITCLEYCKLIESIIDRNMFWNGVIHIHSPETVSKAQIIEMVNDVYNLNLQINYISVKFCDRSLASKYNFPFKVASLRRQIEEMKQFDVLNSLN